MSAIYVEGGKVHLGDGTVRELPVGFTNFESRGDEYSYDLPATYGRTAHYVHAAYGFRLLVVTKDPHCDLLVTADKMSISSASKSKSFARRIVSVWQLAERIVVCLRLPDTGPHPYLRGPVINNPIYCLNKRTETVWTLDGSYYAIGDGRNQTQIIAMRELAIDTIDVASGRVLESEFDR